MAHYVRHLLTFYGETEPICPAAGDRVFPVVCLIVTLCKNSFQSVKCAWSLEKLADNLGMHATIATLLKKNCAQSAASLKCCPVNMFAYRSTWILSFFDCKCLLKSAVTRLTLKYF